MLDAKGVPQRNGSEPPPRDACGGLVAGGRASVYAGDSGRDAESGASDDRAACDDPMALRQRAAFERGGRATPTPGAAERYAARGA